MSIALMPQRPPYVTFEQRAVEDRNASIAAGGMVMKDVDFVIVRQIGSKDTHEKNALEWLSDIDRSAASGQYPMEWARHFRDKYQAYKAGQDEPELGLSVKQWPSLSKAQVENLLSAGVRTVEDIAGMNEPTMRKVGMGARELQKKARTYLETRDANKATEMITSLQVAVEAKDERIASLEARLLALEAGSKKRA